MERPSIRVETRRKRSLSFDGNYENEFTAPSPRRARTSSGDNAGFGKVVIGIVGGSGSGKTTVVNAIKERIEQIGKIAVLPHDAYYHDLGHLPLKERADTNFDHPDSLDTDLLVEHIEKLKSGTPVELPTYDYETATRKQETVTVQATKLIIVEGILAFTHKKLRESCDMKIFIDTEPDVRFIRRLLRDTSDRGRTLDSVISQ
jgi:uridine kinase